MTLSPAIVRATYEGLRAVYGRSRRGLLDAVKLGQAANIAGSSVRCVYKLSEPVRVIYSVVTPASHFVDNHILCWC